MFTAYKTEILGANCLFQQNFQIKKLGEITVVWSGYCQSNDKIIYICI